MKLFKRSAIGGRLLFLFFGLPFIATSLTLADTSTWIGPGSDFNTDSNWSAGVPTDIAAFDANPPTSISLSAPASLNAFQFNPGASPYTIEVYGGQLNNASLSIAGSGIANNSSNLQTFYNHGGRLDFLNSATAGNAAITDSLNINTGSNAATFFRNTSAAGQSTLTNNRASNLQFQDNATAANATITNNGGSTTFLNTSNAGNAAIRNKADNAGAIAETSFGDSASAANSTITNEVGGSTVFSGNATADHATITNVSGGNSLFSATSAGTVLFMNNSSAANAAFNNSGAILFQDNSTGGDAAITNNGNGTVDISQLNSSGMTAGSIAGSGSYILGSKTLTVGGNNQSTTVSGVLSGAGGSLVKVGTGALTLAGANTYTGFTAINGGLVRAGAANTLPNSTAVTIANNSGSSLDLNGFNQTIGSLAGGGAVTLGNAAFTIGTDNTSTAYTGSISGSGSVTKTGTGLLNLTGVNTYSGGTTISGGTLQGNSTSLQGNILDNAFLVFDQSSDGTYAGSLSGTGSLDKIGAGALTFSGNSPYGGNGSIDAGALILTGTLGGNLLVGSGGALSGTGTVGNVTNRGSVTPGLNGNGSLRAFSYSGPGSLTIIFNGPTNTSLNVTNNANVSGGTLNLTGTNFTRGQYSVLNAGTLTGTFAAVNAPTSAFVTFQSEYTPTNVLVDIERNSASFASVATTGNQGSVAGALDASGSSPGPMAPVINAISLLTASQAGQAYNQIGGDALASFQDVSFQSAALFTHQMIERAQVREKVETASLFVPIQVAYTGDVRDLGEMPSAAPSNSLWARGIGSSDKTDGNAALGSPASHSNTGGFQAGVDHAVTDDFLLGVSGGYADTHLTVDDRSSSGETKAAQAGVYGRYRPGAWFFNASAAYTGNSNIMTRTIVFPGISEQANADFKSHVYTGFLEGGYTFMPVETVSLEPSVSLRKSHLQHDAYTETDAPGLNLMVKEQTVDSTVSSLGIHVSRLFFHHRSHPFTLGVRTAWEHELGDTDNLVSAQFADAPGAGFIVQGTPRRRDSAVGGLDGHAVLTQHLQAFADYAATLSTGRTLQQLLGGLSLAW